MISDLHVGSTVGLWPDSHSVEGGGVYTANRFQQWLHHCWQDMIDSVVDRPILVINGDIIQGTNPRDGQLVTNLLSAQTSAAAKLLEPLVAKCAKLYVIRGTEWHEGKASENIEALASHLGAIADPSTSQPTWWELYLNIDGRVIHFAHHVGVSSIANYEATVPYRDALLLLAELARFYGPAAPNVHLAVRSHRHRYIHVDAPPNVQVVITPSWQLRTAFVYKKATAMLPQVGYVTVDNSPHGLQVGRKIYPLPHLHIEEAL